MTPDEIKKIADLERIAAQSMGLAFFKRQAS